MKKVQQTKKQLIQFKFLTPDGELLPVVFLAFDKREGEVMVRKKLSTTHVTYVYKLDEGRLYRNLQNVKDEPKKPWYKNLFGL